MIGSSERHRRSRRPFSNSSSPNREVARRAGLTGIFAVVVVSAAACSSGGTSGLDASSSTGSGATGAVHGSLPESGSAGPRTGPASSGTRSAAPGTGATNPGTGTANPQGVVGSPSPAAPGQSTSPSLVETGSTLPSLAVAFADDDSSFQSVASSTQGALKQAGASTSARQVSQLVQPLLTAATTFQGEIVNLQWPAGAAPSSQSLLATIGQLAAVLNEPSRSVGFSSFSQFDGQVKSAISSVASAASAVSTQIGSS